MVYKCIACGLEYDESVGIPEDNIPAGTLLADLSEDWLCPICGVDKSMFEAK